MKTHHLKCWTEFFGPAWQGKKRFEVRHNDRDFQLGDLVVLQEWSPSLQQYTGREIEGQIAYIMEARTLCQLMDLERMHDYVIFSMAAPLEMRENLYGHPIPPHPCGIQMQAPPLPETSPFEEQDKLDGIVAEGEKLVIRDITQDLKTELDEAAERERADILAAHEEKLRIAHELSVAATEKVAQAQDQVKVHAKTVKQIAALRTELSTYQVPTPAFEEIERLDGLIQAADSAIDAHQRLLVAFDTYQKDLAEAMAADSELPRLQESVNIYDALVKALNPGGIPSEMILEALADLNDYLAVAAEYLFPERTLQVNEELGIDLEGTPYTTLSKSAKFRVGVAFQYALARLAGARMLMIDEADILDHIGRTELIDFLMTQLFHFDQVLVFFTADQPFYAPVADNWWLDRGMLSKVIAG